MENMIDITGIDLKKFVKKVYELSVPIGLGFIRARDGELSDEDAEKIIKGVEFDYPASKTNDSTPIRMDYVHGRCCKMIVFQKDGKLYINNNWNDHSKGQLKKLLKHVGIVL